jgi:uncharacterized protein
MALREIEAFARRTYAGLDFAHDVGHGERVVWLARRIAAEEGGDPFLVEAGAWLHQLHDDLGRLAEFLATLGLDAERRERLVGIVRGCRPDRIGPGCSLEARIVFDADALEVLGPYGAVRELLCNAKVRGKAWAASVADARAVAERFESRLATAAGRRLAAEGVEATTRFWDLYDRWSALRIG